MCQKGVCKDQICNRIDFQRKDTRLNRNRREVACTVKSSGSQEEIAWTTGCGVITKPRALKKKNEFTSSFDFW